MHPVAIEVLETAVRWRGRMRGVGVHTDPWKHFGPGRLAEAEEECARANRDLPAYLRPPRDLPVRNGLHDTGRVAGGVRTERIWFDSPLMSGEPRNDRVELRLWRREQEPSRKVLLFHHPVYQDQWYPWRWFLAPLVARVPVALMVGPYHFDRAPAGWFAGEGTINPNPARVFESIRQWMADQQVAMRALREAGLEPVAAIGFSLGAFQSLLAASIGALHLPVVSIASTNRYAYGLLNGTLGREIVAAMRRIGIDDARLCRLVDSLQLERYVPALFAHPVLYIAGDHDRVDPPPSGERLERALRPWRSLHLDAGHATVTLFRQAVARATLQFLEELRVLPGDSPVADLRGGFDAADVPLPHRRAGDGDA